MARPLGQRMRRTAAACAVVLLPGGAPALDFPLEMAALYANTVDKRLDLPPAEALQYARLIDARLGEAGLGDLPAQYLLVVDRSPLVQTVLLYFKAGGVPPWLIGASPASTGRGRGFDHFETPLGLFDHTLTNPDFRAEGTRNQRGIRGLGVKGMRVYDFGWQTARKGWGDRGMGEMRLLVHATDPVHLERRLGSAQSKGCIRIPASLNRLIDQYGLLDADYERALAEGRTLWVLRPQRQPTPWSGRYLIVLDSNRTERPAWSPDPRAGTRRP